MQMPLYTKPCCNVAQVSSSSCSLSEQSIIGPFTEKEWIRITRRRSEGVETRGNRRRTWTKIVPKARLDHGSDSRSHNTLPSVGTGRRSIGLSDQDCFFLRMAKDLPCDLWFLGQSINIETLWGAVGALQQAWRTQSSSCEDQSAWQVWQKLRKWPDCNSGGGKSTVGRRHTAHS